MIDLNDVLLAMSNIPVDDPIAEIWGRGLQGGYKIIEYTGSLPVTINANGDALLDYRIYGADGGVGVATENLFDKDNVTENYFLSNGVPTYFGFGGYVLSDYIPIASNTATVSARVIALSGSGSHWAVYDENKTFIRGGVAFTAGEMGAVRFAVVDSSGAAFIRVDYALDYLTDCMLSLGSTVPTSYIPYGYKLPMTVIDNLAPPLSQWIDGYITVSGNIAAASIIRREKASDFIEVKPNTQYVFGIEGDAFPQGATENAWVAVCFYRDDQTSIDRYSTNRRVPYTFSTPPETKYVRLSYRTYGELLEPRLSENSFSIPVYIGENQLDSVEGVADYVDKASGKIVRMIGEYTFTGDESFNKYGNSDVFYTSTTIDPVGITTVNTITMRCDHPAFTAIENKDTRYWLNPEADDICCFLPGGRSQVFLRSTSNFTTATECKAYLKAQYDNGTPVKISYWLKTPVEEDPPVPFSDIPTINGETVIDYDGDPKPSQMYVKYKDKSGGA